MCVLAVNNLRISKGKHVSVHKQILGMGVISLLDLLVCMMTALFKKVIFIMNNAHNHSCIFRRHNAL